MCCPSGVNSSLLTLAVTGSGPAGERLRAWRLTFPTPAGMLAGAPLLAWVHGRSEVDVSE